MKIISYWGNKYLVTGNKPFKLLRITPSLGNPVGENRQLISLSFNSLEEINETLQVLKDGGLSDSISLTAGTENVREKARLITDPETYEAIFLTDIRVASIVLRAENLDKKKFNKALERLRELGYKTPYLVNPDTYILK